MYGRTLIIILVVLMWGRSTGPVSAEEMVNPIVKGQFYIRDGDEVIEFFELVNFKHIIGWIGEKKLIIPLDRLRKIVLLTPGSHYACTKSKVGKMKVANNKGKEFILDHARVLEEKKHSCLNGDKLLYTTMNPVTEEVSQTDISITRIFKIELLQ